jgi:hypothetical protein
VPLRPLHYADLEDLLRHEPVPAEDPATAELIARLAHVAARGWFSRAEFLAMCRWKSPRARHHYEKNSPARVRKVARAALATRSERRRIALLTNLDGVSIPMASAILTLIAPRRYGVIDIRVWQLLFAIGAVTRNPRGQGFTAAHWHQYLTRLRHHARRLGVPVRTVEHTLFLCHRKFQRGTLYRERAPSA